MKTFQNRNFIKHNPDCSNIVACVALVAPITSDNRWVEADAEILAHLEVIYVEAGVTFYGFI
jgi:hypothetical protein